MKNAKTTMKNNPLKLSFNILSLLTQR